MSDSAIFTDRETLRLTKDGVFLSDGEEITHARTVAAFHHFLGRDETGYFIRIGRDFKRIEVEDTAYFVIGVQWGSDAVGEPVELLLNDGSREKLDPDTLRFQTERLTCRVKNGREEAKFLRKPYTEILLHSLAEENGYVLHIGGKTIHLGTN